MMVVPMREGKVVGVVHVVDDDASFRNAIARRLELSGYEVASYSCADDLLNRLPDGNELGCILLDVRIPGLNGPDLQRRLSELGSILPVIFLTGHADTAITVQTIKAGAEDFLTKPVPSDQLLGAISRAMARHEVARAERKELDCVRSRAAKLTPREQQVFELIVQGKINKQIAYVLGTTERTIKAHRHQVMEKMQVQSLAELVALSERFDILDANAATDT